MKIQRLMPYATGVGLVMTAGLAHGAYDDPSASGVAVAGFHAVFMYVILATLLVVFGAMFYSIYAHRKSSGRQAAHFHENTAVEVVWAAIPIVILMGAAYPATKTIIEQQAIDSHRFGGQQIVEQRVASR